MGIATPAVPPVTSHSKGYNSLQFVGKQHLSISMSQDYHQGIFSFSNGFERSQQEQQQHHIAQQIRRDKLRVQGFEPPLVGMDEEESTGLPVYETAGILSEMFSFPSAGGATATELLESQILQSYRNPRGGEWFPPRQGMVVGGDLGELKNQNHQHHQPQPQPQPQQHQIPSINADAAMQLFLMNPQQQRQQRSPSPSPSHPPPPSQSTSSTLHMLLPHHSSSSSSAALHHGGGFGQFTWLPNSGNESNPSDIPGGVVEGQGLSLSLSSSLQHLEAAKADELRMGEGNMLFFGQGSAPAQYHMKSLGAGGGGAMPSSSYGAVNMLRNSKYAKAAQELLEEFCSVGRGHFKKNKLRRQNNNDGNPNSNPNGGGGGGNSSSSSKDNPPLSAADRLEHQRRKVKLLSMLDEVDRRYNHYCEQMQMVVNSFDMVMGFGAAVPYTSLAQKAMSRHFRCLKDAIAAQLKLSCDLLGEKDAGTSGVTKGETPRLRMLDQSLRQQRAFHQMGIMEQEAWRPQRGLPERSVNILRAWLFEHFLHPYPSDADKHLLARQTGLSRNQVSNWFINARVRLWKPMVEEMYQQEAKDESGNEQERDQSSGSAQTPTPHTATTSATTAITPPPPNRSDSAHDNDPSFVAINTHCFTDNHATNAAADDMPPPAADALVRFGANAGDVSLTLGLRHAGNLPEKSPFSVRDFGGC
ncbi:BEL1-like homeodomain protein 4 [Salvia miltiorrhiza]|uniref:BEL1-like homeodomain protein 4 n=1 Tax=Salvia miltiorrhiza TaxID=226208 RepID=UPI0025ACAC56|nr:BEL1-like homeodomain protein 4 [Salvia miltiorrhiza]